jgi:hypothetical protein
MHQHGDEPTGGPEVDDTTNPTDAAPTDPAAAYAGDSDTSVAAPVDHSSEDYGVTRVAEAARSGEETWTPGPGDEPVGRGAAGREMLTQLQQMIDTLATQAAPVMREVAVKAAELAAVAGEKAGPIAHRAAGMTERVGQRVAERSKEYAAEIRRKQEGTAADQPTAMPAEGETGTAASADLDRTDDPKSSDWSAS